MRQISDFSTAEQRKTPAEEAVVDSIVRRRQSSHGDIIKNDPKLSEAIKKIAQNMLSEPNRIPSSEAAHAALLFAHAGWNRALGHPLYGFERALAAFEKERPSLWRELRSRSAEDLIAFAETEKMRLWANDRRVILVCGIPDGKVHVEWCYESDYESAKKQVEDAFRSGPRWVRKVNV